MVLYVYFDYARGTISDKILSAGKSRFTARALIAIFGFIVFGVSLNFAISSATLVGNIIWMSLCLSGVGLSMVMSWVSATDLGRNFSGTVSGWMNLWGNIGAMLGPLLAGFLADYLGWVTILRSMTLLVIIAIALWFFVKPDEPLIKDQVDG